MNHSDLSLQRPQSKNNQSQFQYYIDTAARKHFKHIIACDYHNHNGVERVMIISVNQWGINGRCNKTLKK